VRPFEGQVALVTGASRGVGRALALALAEAGAAVGLVGRKPQALGAVADAIAHAGGRAFVFTADLAAEAEIDALAEALGRDPGRVDLLVHSAGVYARGGVGEAATADLEAQWTVNVRAPYALTRALLPLLRAARGQVVFINSTAGLRAPAGATSYAATKHALRALADGLRDEVNADGVRVLSVFLGRTATPMQAAIHAAEGRPWDPGRLIQPEDVAAIVRAALALPRTAEVTDLTLRPMRPPA
jgi:NAD(P)-dependent dehydrogenase (short-subunit alcohol dehydrogenase family)